MTTRNSHPSATHQAIEARLAEQAYYQSASTPDLEYDLKAHNSDHARNYALTKKLTTIFMEQFKMDARQAREEVEREMADKYPPNPWDAPAPRKHQQRRGSSKDSGDMKTDISQSSKSAEYSEEQWDLFEKMLR